MDVRYSSEQVALADSVRRAIGAHGPTAVGALDDAARSAALDGAVAEAGWRQLRTPSDEAGTPWGSVVDVAVVAEGLARGAADVAFLGPTLAAELRRLAGATDAEADESVALTPDLAELADGTGPAVAIDGTRVAAALAAVPEGDGWRLVRSTALEPLGGSDLTRPTASVDLSAAEPVDGRLLGADDLRRLTAVGLAVTAAELVGAMEGVTAMTVDYAKERRQYGQAIGGFQAVQHLLADAVVHTEGSRSATLRAIWGADALPPDEAVAAAASAKAYAQRAARAVGEIAIQVHGGIGNTWECMAHVYLRRSLLSSAAFGSIGANLERVLARDQIGAC